MRQDGDEFAAVCDRHGPAGRPSPAHRRARVIVQLLDREDGGGRHAVRVAGVVGASGVTESPRSHRGGIRGCSRGHRDLRLHRTLPEGYSELPEDRSTGNAAYTGEWPLPIPFACRIIEVWVTDSDGIAADNTDYVDRDITGTTGYDSRAANQGALTADTPLELTLSPGGVVIAAGGLLKVTLAKGGSGKATEAAVCWLLEPAN
jgi:hypothetical protein